MVQESPELWPSPSQLKEGVPAKPAIFLLFLEREKVVGMHGHM